MKENILNNLTSQGYYIFENILDKNSIDYGRHCFNKTKINYLNIEKFINNNVLKTVNYKLGKSLFSIKYRASNNNNSIDAAALHRDVHNHKSQTTMNIFTYILLKY